MPQDNLLEYPKYPEPRRHLDVKIVYSVLKLITPYEICIIVYEEHPGLRGHLDVKVNP